MNITRGIQPKPLKVVVYGPEGIGKSTFASLFPDPLFIDTEGSTARMDVARTETPTSLAMLTQLLTEIRDNPPGCRTLIIDTIDWAERLCIQKVCAENHKDGIEDFGYGKGYTYVYEETGRILNLLNDIWERGMHVVLTAHAAIRKFEQPDEMGAYDRWELKLSNKTAPLLKEWPDALLFLNFKTYVVATDANTHKAQGGKRVIYTSHHPCWDAKNRFGLPDEMPFDYKQIAHLFGEAKPVRIGSGSWIGHGAVVLPGAYIGEHVVVGAGSVVTGKVPDYCVAVGSPARVIRRYDLADPDRGWYPVDE
jgi:acetyltransferase-like isoleucine patch superfamily enzyme